MELLDKYPIILTKDQQFAIKAAKNPIKEGSIVILPEDAVLVIPKDPPEAK